MPAAKESEDAEGADGGDPSDPQLERAADMLRGLLVFRDR